MVDILNPRQQDYLNKFRKPQDALIVRMEKFASVKNIPILNWHAAEFMEQLILLQKPKRILEIGTAIAYSTIRIAKCLEEDATIDTIEKSKDNIPIARDNISKSDCTGKIRLLEGEALEIIPGLKDQYDIIFLDADKEDYNNLFEASLPLLKKHGTYIVDNLLWHGYIAAENIPDKFIRSTKLLREFNEIFMNTNELNSIIIAVGDGLGIGIKQ